MQILKDLEPLLTLLGIILGVIVGQIIWNWWDKRPIKR